ncbi:MAG: peptidylprolyl isomerase [Sphingobacteriia bacterium]|nr:peptidylprolyl isomerase [Sphingobacteriia bacterium]
MNFVRKSIFLMSLSIMASFAMSQNQGQVLLDVAGEKTTVGEFMQIYKKNNNQGEALDKKSISEYLQLYINFRLKVRDAVDAGLDTSKAFKHELAGYRKQLAQPYFTDESVVEALIKEGYDRMKSDVRASHILVRCPENALPKDTLIAWKKINDIYAKLLKGSDFAKTAYEYSEDPSAKGIEGSDRQAPIKANRGDLGYFSVFNMVYPFETAAYKTDIGKFSKPIRTSFGYHIIKVTDRKNALGKVVAAHIFFPLNNKSVKSDSLKAAATADSVYQLLKKGASFDTLALLVSKDKGTSTKGGVLPPFTCNRLVPEFVSVLYNLKPGEVAPPVLTPYGWHVIKLIEKPGIPAFETVQADIRQKVNRDTRGNQSKESVIARLKVEYAYSENLKALPAVTALVTDSIFRGTWKPVAEKMDKVLFSFADQKYTQQNFIDYLVSTQRKGAPEPIEVYVTKQFASFADDKLFTYEDNNLEAKYPDFAALVKEYHDGILLFDRTDKLVWSKAVKDTTGLKEFYQTVKNNYLYPERVEATSLIVKNIDGEKKAKKILDRCVKQFIDKAVAVNDLKKQLEKDEELVVITVTDKYVPGEDTLIFDLAKSAGAFTQKIVKESDETYTVEIIKNDRMVAPEPKPLEEVKGLVTADYQNYLEKLWVDSLKQRYPVSVNEEVLKSIQ